MLHFLNYVFPSALLLFIHVNLALYRLHAHLADALPISKFIITKLPCFPYFTNLFLIDCREYF